MAPRLLCATPEKLAAASQPGEALLRAFPGQPTLGLAQQVLCQGLMSLPQGPGPIERVLVPPNPTLDDVLAAHLCTLETPPAVSEPLLALCDYAAQLREGLLPGTLPPERSLGGIYLAMGELYRDQPDVLLGRGVRLVARTLAAIEKGQSPLCDDIWGQDPLLSRERLYLQQDRERYLRDRQGGEVWRGWVGPHQVRLLWLFRPTCILFRLFLAQGQGALQEARFDGLVVVRGGRGGRLHLSMLCDPTRRLPLREVLVPLAQDLSRREAARDPTSEPWYDGAYHQHHRLASPRAGSVLPLWTIAAAMRKALAVRRVRIVHGAPVALGLAIALSLRPSPPPGEDVAVRSDWQAHRLPQGPPASQKELGELSRVRSFALIVAANKYPLRSQGGLGPLRTPWRDACTLRELLVRRFGYQRSDIITLSDAPCLRDVAGPPTRQQILWTVEHMPVRPDDTLLFYYAGHGAIEEEPGGRYGYLQPLGWERGGVAREDRGLRMRVLAELLRDKVAARHQLLLIDACHSGETAIVRGDDMLSRLSAPVRANWRKRPVYAVITAAGTADLALEERLIDATFPHSLFLRAMIEGLSFAPHGGACRLRADQDPGGSPDGLITDGELFKWVTQRVPELRQNIQVPGLPDHAQRQVPEWNPWAAAPRGERTQRIGEFLLIPESPPETCSDEPEPDPEPCRPAACDSP